MEKNRLQTSTRVSHGIMQGRLTKPVDHRLQFFPKDTWKSEFDIAEKLGFKFIEGVIDSEPLSHPLIQPDGLEFIRERNLLGPCKMKTLCLHIFVEIPVWSFGSLEDLCRRASTALIEKLVLPLEGASSLKVVSKSQREFLHQFASIAKKFNLQVLIETTDVSTWASLLAELNEASLGLNFDTGNISAEFGSEESLRLFSRVKPWVKGIHLKDKKATGESVAFGTGIVDFKEFINAFQEMNLPLIHESYRGQKDDPVQMAERNLEFLKSCSEQ